MNPESTRNILRTRRKIGNGRLLKLLVDTLDSSRMKKTTADFNGQRNEIRVHM